MDGTGRRRIYLMRHGHVDYFDPELTDFRLAELTPDGEQQAQAAAVALGGAHFDIAVSSGLPRSNKTAQIVLSAHENAPVLGHHTGLEELRSGRVKAKSREELAARLAYSFDDASADDARFLPDGEAFVDAQQRSIAAIEEIVFSSKWKQALIVAHEGINRILLGWACGGGLKTVPSFEQDLACINVIDLDVAPHQSGQGLVIERAIIKAMNVTPYDYVKFDLQRTCLEHLFEIDFGASRPADWTRTAQ